MGLIDSHAHLTAPSILENIDRVLDHARQNGVEIILSIAVDVRDSGRVVDLARERETVFAAVGIHPHEAGKVIEEDWAPLEALIHEPKVAALGEMGLDYHYDFSPRDAQQRVFARQLKIAAALDLPLVIHCREAVEDTVAMLCDHGFERRRVVFHCFSGTAQDAELIARHGWRISFTGMVTFKNAGALQSIAAAYPADQLMLETDSPYLSPEPVRNQRLNVPGHVRHLAEFLARLRRVSLDKLTLQTAANTRAFFRLEMQERET